MYIKMLKFKIVEFNFFRFIQSGLYIDFFLKKIIEIFVKNVFIYSAQFMGEKYIIEFLTKKVIDSSIFNINKLINFNDLFYSYYFIQLLCFFFYFFSILNIYFVI
jgi:hypothetical protein